MKAKIRKNGRGGLGPGEAAALSTLSSGFLDQVFTVREAEKALKMKGGRLRKLLFDLAESRWIERIERGKYLLIPLEAGPGASYGTHPFMYARKLATPYYIGFASALNYYGITEQVSRTTYVATTKQKKPLGFHAQRYQFVRLDRKRFFGFEEEWLGRVTFRISDREKTVVDCLFMPEYSGGISEIAKAFKEKLDIGKLCEYAFRMEDMATVKRLGYLLDKLKVNKASAEKLLLDIGGGYCLLDTAGPRTGAKNKKWKVIENIDTNGLGAES